ncbi:MAG TPA: hypothetical protein VD837_03100 [Terriglobales bacterium]|nr:hypothetical protein [Terriglobales bacterium]
MKRAIFSTVLLVVLVGLTSCGGDGSSDQPTTSEIKTRAIVSNSYVGSLNIIDYSRDLQSFTTINVGTQPRFMVLSKDRKLVLSVDGLSTVVAVNTETESVVGSVTLPNWTESLVISPDNKTAWAAVPNAAVAGASQTGVIQPIDMTNWTLGTAIPVPLARHVAMNNAGNKLVVLSDPTSQVANPISVVDITDVTKPQVTKRIPVGAGVDRPIRTAFGSDDAKAYILNCGRECGGTSSSVSVLDVAAGALVAGSGVPVVAGSVLLLDGSNLYVAGTVPSTNQGALTVVSVSGTTLTASDPVAIGDGFHTTMLLAGNNKLLVGANPCSNEPVGGSETPKGCLTIFDTGTRKAVVQPAKGYVTGMSLVPKRNVVYVAEGEELRIYDTSTSAEFTGRFIDVFGSVSDVKVLDQQ